LRHSVVPAKAGTHTAESIELNAVDVVLRLNSSLWLWVPAFAGTTTRGVSIAVPYAATAGTGRAVIDLIFSIAKREVTFFSVTVAISFL